MNFKTFVDESSVNDNIKKHISTALSDIERFSVKIEKALKSDNIKQAKHYSDFIKSSLSDIEDFLNSPKINESQDGIETDQRMQMYKEIKKQKGYKATFYDEDFNVTDSFKMKLKDGSKIKVLLNTTSFDKPVYWFEWL